MTEPQTIVTLDTADAECLYAALGAALNPPPVAEPPVAEAPEVEPATVESAPVADPTPPAESAGPTEPLSSITDERAINVPGSEPKVAAEEPEPVDPTPAVSLDLAQPSEPAAADPASELGVPGGDAPAPGAGEDPRL